MKKILASLYFFSIATVVIAQSPTGAHIQQYTTENGLPSNLIRGIQWDNNTGFLWVITEGGLVRMNGIEFKSYSKEKISPVAPEKQVFAVKNNQGNIFISDGSGNIFEIKNNRPVFSKPAPANDVFTNYHFIAVSDNFFKAKSKIDPVFSAPFEKLICLSDTSCLILFENTIYKYSISDKMPSATVNNCSALYKIGDKCFYTDINKRCFLLNTNNFSAEEVNVEDSQRSLFNFNNASSLLFWNTGMTEPVIIKDNEAWKLDHSSGRITATLISNMLPTDANISTVVYLKAQGLLFIGTDSKGIITIKENLVQPRKRKNSNPKNKNAYFSQIALDNGNILTNEGDIIGDNSGDAVLPATGKFSNRTSFTNGDLLWYNAVNASTGIYCLHQFNKTTKKLKVFEKIQPLTQVEVSGNRIYLANNDGIGLLQGDSMYYIYRYPANAVNVKTYDFKEIEPGILAIAGCSGLLRFNTATNKLDTIYSLQNACFGSIWKYKDYVFWGSYGYGFYIYKNGIIKKMPLDKNEYLLYSHCFAPDDNGYCWISTNRGLFKAKIDDLINAYEQNTPRVYYHYFGKNDGMDITEMNGGCTPCALYMKDQHLSFPTMDGLLWVNPDKAMPILPSGDIYIDEVIIDNENKDPEYLTQHALPASTGDIVFHLAFSAWCNKENIYIEYQLNDTLNWKPVSLENGTEIRFNNLSYGNYKLRIRKMTGFGINNYTYKEIRFSIVTPWYKQWWFYILMSLATLGLIWLYLRIRINQYRARQQKLEKQVADKTKELQEQNEVLEKNNSIKTRLISIISHDIVTPLKFVTVAGKKLIEKRSMMSEELQQETIREMTNTSQELQLLSTNILNWIKYQNENRRQTKEEFNPHEMINQLLGILNTLAKQKNLTLKNQVNADLNIYQYFEPLKILIYNLLTNAINFSEKGDIKIAATINADNVIISVSDEGVGMTADQIKNVMANEFIVSSANMDNRKGNGLGYLIIKDLVKMMGATLSIKSEKGKGTTVSVLLPVNKNGKTD